MANNKTKTQTETKMKTQEKAEKNIKMQTTAILCESFELTNDLDASDVTTAIVRGWIMDELEARDADKFNQWIDTDDIEKMDTPSAFFN